jgi:sensor histidine kinase YesM
MASVYSFSIGLPCGLVLPFIGEALAKWRMSAKMIVIGAAILVMAALGGLVAGVLFIWFGMIRAADFWPQYWFALRVSSVIGVGVGCTAFAYERVRDRLEETTLELRTRELEQERAQKLFAEARLSSLESRIHPHFFFNTLNSIAALIPEDPKRAEEIVSRLAALLRFSLDSSRNSLVPLAQEIMIVRDYLEIERVRFGDRLRYSIDVPPQLESAQVPPLAVQTLVENSVKHAIAGRREGGEVRIAARASGDGLALSVSDTGPGFRLEQAQPGHGIDNLIGRLAVLFGDAAAISTAHEDGRPAVRIAVPLA